jgi:hypothetical protein
VNEKKSPYLKKIQKNRLYPPEKPQKTFSFAEVSAIGLSLNNK